MVHPHERLNAERISFDRMGGPAAEDERSKIRGQRLNEVDLALEQRVDLGLRVGNRDQLDAVDFGDLAAGCPDGWLATRHIGLVAHDHEREAGIALSRHEAEWARSDDLLDLFRARCFGQPFGHHERHDGANLAERMQYELERLFQNQPEASVINDRHRGRGTQERTAHGIARSPTPDRRHAVFGSHRRTVVPGQSRPQHESVGQAVRAYRPGVDHLRLRLKSVVHRKQRVKHQVAKIANLETGAEMRIEDAGQRFGCETDRGLRVRGKLCLVEYDSEKKADQLRAHVGSQMERAPQKFSSGACHSWQGGAMPAPQCR